MHSHWHHCPETHWQWQACLSEGCCLKENEIQSCPIKKQMGVSLTEPLPWQKTFNQSFSKLQQWSVCTLTVYSFQWWPALTTDVQSTPLRYYRLELETLLLLLLTTTTYLSTWNCLNWIITAGKSHIDSCKMSSCTISVHKSQYKLSIKAIRDVVHMEAMQVGRCDVTEQCHLLLT